MDHKIHLKASPVVIFCLFALTACPSTRVSRVKRADQTPPEVTMVITFRDSATGKTTLHQVVSPPASGDISVRVTVPPPPLPPAEAKGVEIEVRAIARDPEGVSHVRIMRTAAPGMRWKGKPPGPINRFSDDAQAREELRGTLVLSQKGSTITLFAEAFNFGPGTSQGSRTAKLTITTR